MLGSQLKKLGVLELSCPLCKQDVERVGVVANMESRSTYVELSDSEAAAGQTIKEFVRTASRLPRPSSTRQLATSVLAELTKLEESKLARKTRRRNLHSLSVHWAAMHGEPARVMALLARFHLRRRPTRSPSLAVLVVVHK